MSRFNFMKNTEHSPWTLICSKANKFQSQLDVLTFNGVGNPKSKSLKYNGKTLVAFDYLGNTIVVYEKLDNKLNIYTTETTLKSSFDGKLDLNCISICDDNWLFGSSNDGKIHVYDLIKEKVKKSIKTSSENPITGFDISLDHRNVIFHYDNGLAAVLQTKSTKIDSLSWISEQISCLKTSPWRKSNFLAGCTNGIVALFDVDTKTKVFNGNYHENGINSIAYSYYNEYLALSAGKDNQAILWATNSVKPQKIHQTKSPVTSCSMSDRILYSFGEMNGNLWIFDIRNTRDPVFFHQFPSGCNDINHLQFKYDLFHKNISAENFESTIVECTDDENNLNYLDSSVASCFSEPSDQSINSSRFKQANQYNDSFNVSRFPQLKQHQFSLSPVMDNIDHPSPPSGEGKTRKQVQFVNDISSESNSPINRNSNNYQSVNVKPRTVVESGAGGDREFGAGGDRDSGNTIWRGIIKEEIENVLIPMEERLRTQLLVEIVDQLAITEKTIIDSLKPVIQQTEELVTENEILRKELQKYKYFSL